ncbi:D-glycerate 3-kinase [Durusdinium trenchii]
MVPRHVGRLGLAALAAGASVVGRAPERRREDQLPASQHHTRTCRCEVRLWGPGGTLGRSAEVLASEAAAEAAKRKLQSPAEELEDFIQKGPLYSRLLLSCPSPPLTEWMEKGELLAKQLSANVTNLSDREMAKRIYHLYLPWYFWMRHQMIEIRSARSREGPSAVVFGISAPQGFGKTTANESLSLLFHADGLSFQAISIDDFYLPASWQEEVAQVYSENELLELRGNPGTHDVHLGEETLKALKRVEQGEVCIPRFDKSALNGKGDQLPRNRWDRVQTPCDVVVVEGWMVGFSACDGQDVAKIHPGLRLVNEKLKKYQAWNDLIDCFCVFAMDEIDQVYTWRLQAEEAMKRSGRGGMSSEEVKRFVNRFMPAYLAYRPQLYAAAAEGSVSGKTALLCKIGRDRSVL